jgi:hypothetical protein
VQQAFRLKPFAFSLTPFRKFAVASLQFAGQFVFASNHLPFDKLRATGLSPYAFRLPPSAFRLPLPTTEAAKQPTL